MNKRQLKQIKDHEITKRRINNKERREEKESNKIDKYLFDKFIENGANKLIFLGILSIPLFMGFIFLTEVWNDGILRFIVSFLIFYSFTSYLKWKMINNLRIKLGFSKERRMGKWKKGQYMKQQY